MESFSPSAHGFCFKLPKILFAMMCSIMNGHELLSFSVALKHNKFRLRFYYGSIEEISSILPLLPPSNLLRTHQKATFQPLSSRTFSSKEAALPPFRNLPWDTTSWICMYMQLVVLNRPDNTHDRFFQVNRCRAWSSGSTLLIQLLLFPYKLAVVMPTHHGVTESWPGDWYLLLVPVRSYLSSSSPKSSSIV